MLMLLWLSHVLNWIYASQDFPPNTETEIPTVAYMQEGSSEKTVAYIFKLFSRVTILSEGFSALSF